MNDPEKSWSYANAQRCDLLAISAAKCGNEKLILLTLRMTPNSFEVTELTFPVSQARERLQADLADVLERHPFFTEENPYAP